MKKALFFTSAVLCAVLIKTLISKHLVATDSATTQSPISTNVGAAPAKRTTPDLYTSQLGCMNGLMATLDEVGYKGNASQGLARCAAALESGDKATAICEYRNIIGSEPNFASAMKGAVDIEKLPAPAGEKYFAHGSNGLNVAAHERSAEIAVQGFLSELAVRHGVAASSHRNGVTNSQNEDALCEPCVLFGQFNLCLSGSVVNLLFGFPQRSTMTCSK